MASAVRAIILAAGRGSRMAHLTDAKPKCLTSLAGKALLEWQIAALRTAGIREIAIATGYRAETLRPFGDAAFHNPRWAETNMVRTLACATSWLETGPCLVSYADVVYHPDNVRALLAADADLSLTYDLLWETLWSDRFDNPLSDAETFKTNGGNHLVEIGRRPTHRSQVQGQFMGLLKFSPSGWKAVRALVDSLPPQEVDKLDTTGTLMRLIDREVNIQAVPVGGKWCEVDNECDLRLYESKLQLAEPWPHDWRW